MLSQPAQTLYNGLVLHDKSILQNYINQRNMAITPDDIITIMQDACEIGQPIVDTVCPIIEVIPT